MKTIFKRAAWTPVILVLLGFDHCSDKGAPPEQAQAIAQFADTWQSSCLENPQTAANASADAVNGFVRETLEIEGTGAVQTFRYYQDAECSIATVPGQVANQDETFFLQQQSVSMLINYPFGMTDTELGKAQYINLEQLSVSIDGEALDEEELVENDISLSRLLGIFVVTESDRLHISSDSQSRPMAVPLDYFYTRAP